MAAIDLIETRRLDVQSRLDALKTQNERNKLGQFATPTALATDILEYARALVDPGSPIRFLDPAIGTGAFYAALLRSFTDERIAAADGFEIDPHYGLETLRLWQGSRLNVRIDDFTQVTPPKTDDDKANLLICNPPYVRHHHLSSGEKQRLQRLAERHAGVRLSGLAGLYCHFLCIAHAWMAQDSIAGWLIPSEFMDVNYGEQIKHYLLTGVTLLRIHRFDPDDVQFGDALVSSAVVWFRKATPGDQHVVEFTYGGTLASPRVREHIPASVLREAPKWTRFPALKESTPAHAQGHRLADFFKIQRGLVTGSNEFFILTPEQIATYQLPAKFLLPVLPSPRYLARDEIAADERGEPSIDRKLFLLSCDLPEDTVRSSYPMLWNYYRRGVELGINERYLCRNRSPWYAQELRPPATFLCTYMGRRDAGGGKPFRFILNHSRATAANVYLLLYPKPMLARALHEHPHLSHAVWQALRSITAEQLIGEGRVYGGGLHKMEPKELGNAPAEGIAALLSGFDAARQLSLFGD